jgi:hypothetical protein
MRRRPRQSPRRWLAPRAPRWSDAGPLVMGAALAALALEHGAILHTTDRDFSRFPGLRWTNPLAPAS